MTTRRGLLVVGAGGFAREVVQVARAINRVQPTFELLGHLDDDPATHGRDVDGLEVLGPVELAQSVSDALVVVATGRPGDYGSRWRISTRLQLPPERWATLIHPAASIAESVTVAEGSMLLAGVVATGGSTVGRHVAVMPHCLITHDVVLEDFATLAGGALLGGGVRVHRGAYVGSGARVREQLEIGAWSLVGMGSLVTRSVPAGEVWYGAPARHQGAAASVEAAL